MAPVLNDVADTSLCAVAEATRPGNVDNKKHKKTITMTTSRHILIAISFGIAVSRGAIAQTNGPAIDPETEKKEAAAGFLLPQAMALSVLRRECQKWLAGSGEDVDAIGKGWWQRNREDLDAASAITAEAVRRYRSTLPASQAAYAERQMLIAMTNANVSTLRSIFQRKLPTPETCRIAVLRYKTPLLDVANLGTTKGYERFSEFGETFKKVRADKSYAPPAEQFRTFETQVGIGINPLITLDAIEAAKERRDPAGQVEGFASLAGRGDAQAAQALGSLYLGGQSVPRNYPMALLWFYNAWALGEPEGINALGVMFRDGLAVAVDNKLALAAFAVAQKTSSYGNPNGRQRAINNYARLLQLSGDKILAEAGCMQWGQLDEGFRKNIASMIPSVTGGQLYPSPKLMMGTLVAAGMFEPKLGKSSSCS